MEKYTLQNHKITQSDDKIEGKKVSSMSKFFFLSRRTLDMNRREVQEALNSRGEGGNRGSYGRDRHMGYDGGRRGLDDRGRGDSDSNQRDRYRRDSPGRPRVVMEVFFPL